MVAEPNFPILVHSHLILYALDIGRFVYHFLQYIYIPTRYTT